jgi:hypothetical protein
VLLHVSHNSARALAIRFLAQPAYTRAGSEVLSER